jgi:hypothetical protein
LHLVFETKFYRSVAVFEKSQATLCACLNLGILSVIVIAVRLSRLRDPQTYGNPTTISTGAVQEQYRRVQEQYRSSTGAVQEQYRSSAGAVQEQYRSSTGAVQKQYDAGAAQGRTGPVPEQSSSSTSPHTRRFKRHAKGFKRDEERTRTLATAHMLETRRRQQVVKGKGEQRRGEEEEGEEEEEGRRRLEKDGKE